MHLFLWPELVPTFSCHLFPDSGQDCLAGVTPFKDHVFDIPSVQQTYVGVVVDLNGTQLQLRAERAPWDTRRSFLWAEEWGRGAAFPPTAHPRAAGKYMAELRIGCREHQPTPGESPSLPEPSSASHQLEQMSSPSVLPPGKGGW